MTMNNIDLTVYTVVALHWTDLDTNYGGFSIIDPKEADTYISDLKDTIRSDAMEHNRTLMSYNDKPIGKYVIYGFTDTGIDVHTLSIHCKREYDKNHLDITSECAHYHISNDYAWIGEIYKDTRYPPIITIHQDFEAAKEMVLSYPSDYEVRAVHKVIMKRDRTVFTKVYDTGRYDYHSHIIDEIYDHISQIMFSEVYSYNSNNEPNDISMWDGGFWVYQMNYDILKTHINDIRIDQRSGGSPLLWAPCDTKKY